MRRPWPMCRRGDLYRWYEFEFLKAWEQTKIVDSVTIHPKWNVSHLNLNRFCVFSSQFDNFRARRHSPFVLMNCHHIGNDDFSVIRY